MGNKVLIIEDDVNFLYGLEAKFSAEGVDVSAHNGFEPPELIIDRINRYLPSFIILEIALSGFGGLDFLKKIKSDDYIGHIPVFVYSNLNSGIKDECLRRGAHSAHDKKELGLDYFVKKILKIAEARSIL